MGNTNYNVNVKNDLKAIDSLHEIHKIHNEKYLGPLADHNKNRINTIISLLNVRQKKTLLLELARIQNRNNGEEYAYNTLRLWL